MVYDYVDGKNIDLLLKKQWKNQATKECKQINESAENILATESAAAAVAVFMT